MKYHVIREATFRYEIDVEASNYDNARTITEALIAYDPEQFKVKDWVDWEVINISPHLKHCEECLGETLHAWDGEKFSCTEHKQLELGL